MLGPLSCWFCQRMLPREELMKLQRRESPKLVWAAQSLLFATTTYIQYVAFK